MFLCLGSVYSTLFGVYTIKLRAGEGTHPYEMGESSGSAVGADDLGGPRAAFGRLPHPSGLRPATFP